MLNSHPWSTGKTSTLVGVSGAGDSVLATLAGEGMAALAENLCPLLAFVVGILGRR